MNLSSLCLTEPPEHRTLPPGQGRHRLQPLEEPTAIAAAGDQPDRAGRRALYHRGETAGATKRGNLTATAAAAPAARPGGWTEGGEIGTRTGTGIGPRDGEEGTQPMDRGVRFPSRPRCCMCGTWATRIR